MLKYIQHSSNLQTLLWTSPDNRLDVGGRWGGVGEFVENRLVSEGENKYIKHVHIWESKSVYMYVVHVCGFFFVIVLCVGCKLKLIFSELNQTCIVLYK